MLIGALFQHKIIILNLKMVGHMKYLYHPQKLMHQLIKLATLSFDEIIGRSIGPVPTIYISGVRPRENL